MAGKRYDATIRHLVEAHVADWLAYAGLPIGPATELSIVDSDVSAITSATDKVIRVDGSEPYIAHIEFQSGVDVRFDERMLFYHSLLRWRHKLPVWTVALLLYPRAIHGGSAGRLTYASSHGRLDFSYRRINVWEQPAHVFLQGGLGTLPLAPIGAVSEAELPDVYRRVREQALRELPIDVAHELLVATTMLMGVRHPRKLISRIGKGVNMPIESVTFDLFVEEGELRALRSTITKLGTKRFGPPPGDIVKMLDGIEEVPVLEHAVERVLDATGWNDLLSLPA